MLLSDRTIENHISTDKIGVDPKPSSEQIQPASLDVRLGNNLYEFYTNQESQQRAHNLQPGQRYLGHTVEEISLPNNIAAQLAGRSSIGRQGVIVHKTAGWIDPGFSGQITLELMNLGKEPVMLNRGERVAQLVFFKLDQYSTGYDGSYQGQEGATKAQ